MKLPKVAPLIEVVNKTVLRLGNVYLFTLHGINISHLGKRNIIFKMPFLRDMLVSWRVLPEKLTYPLKIDAWKMTLPLWKWYMFSGKEFVQFFRVDFKSFILCSELKKTLKKSPASKFIHWEQIYTSRKINGWFTYSHHPFGKEDDLKQTSMKTCSMLVNLPTV